MFAENIFANQNLSAKFAKIFSRENFPLYGIWTPEWYTGTYGHLRGARTQMGTGKVPGNV